MTDKTVKFAEGETVAEAAPAVVEPSKFTPHPDVSRILGNLLVLVSEIN